MAYTFQNEQCMPEYRVMRVFEFRIKISTQPSWFLLIQRILKPLFVFHLRMHVHIRDCSISYDSMLSEKLVWWA